MSVRELRPIPLRLSDYDDVEARIVAVFREGLYWPLTRELTLTRRSISNASDALSRAIRAGHVRYSRGRFSGRFTASISRTLSKLGATWDRATETWRLPSAELPPDLKADIATSEARFQERVDAAQRRLARLDTGKLARSFVASDLFDRSIHRTDGDVRRTLKAVSVAPQLSEGDRRRIAEEWQENLRLYIKGFADEEILDLRRRIRKSVESGNRHEALVGTIRRSFGVTERKAKFLARQETNLLVTRLKEARYRAAGVVEYRWRCVAGSPKHPVRPAHRKLDGTLQRFDTPPITSEPGQPVRRNNPGQDFNCRCVAIPVVKF